MFKKKIQHTKFIFVIEEPTRMEADILVNWTTDTLLGGDELFLKIHKEGGTLISKNILHYKSTSNVEVVPVSLILPTTSGILKYRNILHAVLPNYRIPSQKEAKASLLRQTLTNLFLYIEEHKDQFESFRTLCVTPIPTKVFGKLQHDTIHDFIALTIQGSIKAKLREVCIVCTEETYGNYLREFDLQTTTKLQRIFRYVGIIS